MRKKQKWFTGIFLCLLVIMMGSFTGCGKKKVTAKSLLKEAEQNMEGVDSWSGSLKLDMGMSVKASGVSMDLDMAGDMEMEATREPEAAHMKGTMSMSLMGISIDMENYTVLEDGEAVTYTGSAGQWSKTRSESETVSGSTDRIWKVMEQDSLFTLEDKTETLEGKEVYVLKGKLSGGSLNGMEEILGSDVDEIMGEVDWSDIGAEVTVKIDREKKLPAEISVDCGEGMNKALGSLSEEDGTEIQIKQLVLTIGLKSFNDVEEILVPDEVKAAAVKTAGDSDDTGIDSFLNGKETEGGGEGGFVDGEEPGVSDFTGPIANEDGTYVLKSFWGDKSVDIGVPAGYEVSRYSDETYLSFTDNANQDSAEVYLSYSLSSDYTEKELIENYQTEIAYYEADEDYSDVAAEEPKKVQTSKGEAGYIKVSYVYDEYSNYVEYYAYLFLEDKHVLECRIEEHAYQQPCGMVDESTIMETVFSVLKKGENG